MAQGDGHRCGGIVSEASRSLGSQLQLESGERLLVEALKARNPDAWEELFLDSYERLRRYAILHLHSAQEAEDVCSKVFVTALARIDSYEYRGKPVVAWLYGIAQNMIRAQIRSSQRQTAGEPDEAHSIIAARDDNGSTGHLDLLDLRSAVLHLTRQQQEVIGLMHFGGFRAREVAAMLGKSERSIYYLEARALVRLYKELGAGNDRSRAR